MNNGSFSTDKNAGFSSMKNNSTAQDKSIFLWRKLQSKIYYSISWEDAVLILLILAFIFINSIYLGQLQQLPGPLYGGDYYNHLGTMEDLYQGGSVFESGQLVGEIQWVPWLYHVLVIFFAKLSGLTVMKANIYFSIIALVLAMGVMYLLASLFFKNKIYGLISSLWITIYFPIFKYSPFSFYIVLPAFILAAFLFLKHKSWPYAILLGMAYGIAGLSNTYMFIVTSIFMMFYFSYHIIITNSNYKRFSRKAQLKEYFDYSSAKLDFLKSLLIFFLGFLIALLWWYHPIFVYHASTANDMQVYGFNEVSGLSGMISLVFEGLQSEFFRYGRGILLIIPIGTVLGILLLLLLNKKSESHILLLLLLLTSFFALGIHFLTLPILGTLLASGGLFQVGMLITSWLIFLTIISFISGKLNRINKYFPFIMTAIVAALVIYGSVQHYQGLDNNQWWNVGKSPLYPHILETGEWLLKNTQLKDVFLTTNENGFALNAISGRKVVTYRRTHTSTYADMNQRMLDTGIMLYSPNDTLRLKLIDKYSVDYLYWESTWLRNEFQINENWQIVGFFDPLSIDYSLERELTLKQANVSFIRTKWYLDPAWGPKFPKRDLLIIIPARNEYQKPWDATFDKYLDLVYEIYQAEQPITRIYKVNLEPKFTDQQGTIIQDNSINEEFSPSTD